MPYDDETTRDNAEYLAAVKFLVGLTRLIQLQAIEDELECLELADTEQGFV